MRIRLDRAIVGLFIMAAGFFVVWTAPGYNGQWVIGGIIMVVGAAFILWGARHDPA